LGLAADGARRPAWPWCLWHIAGSPVTPGKARCGVRGRPVGAALARRLGHLQDARPQPNAADPRRPGNRSARRRRRWQTFRAVAQRWPAPYGTSPRGSGPLRDGRSERPARPGAFAPARRRWAWLGCGVAAALAMERRPSTWPAGQGPRRLWGRHVCAGSQGLLGLRAHCSLARRSPGNLSRPWPIAMDMPSACALESARSATGWTWRSRPSQGPR